VEVGVAFIVIVVVICYFYSYNLFAVEESEVIIGELLSLFFIRTAKRYRSTSSFFSFVVVIVMTILASCDNGYMVISLRSMMQS
jgi:hypothetical protein